MCANSHPTVKSVKYRWIGPLHDAGAGIGLHPGGAGLPGARNLNVRWLNSIRRRRSADIRAGVAASDEAIALAVVRHKANGRPRLVHCAVAQASLGFADGALRRMLREYDLGKTPVSAVIGANDYQLAQMPAPEVPEAELRAAARWRMREVIDFALDDSTVDVFNVPQQRDQAARRMLFAVASRGDMPQFIAMALQRHAVHMDVIDIPELCQRNLCTLLPQDAKGVAFVMLREDHAQLVLTRQGRLFVARRFDYDSHDHMLELDGSPSRSIVDPNALALELQRSLDYYETHFDQPAITDLVVAPADALTPQLAEEVAALTGLRVHPFALGEHIDMPEALAVPQGWLPVLAIGAALRTDGKAA
jgi:MSHA biogenesis protein MshI